MTRLADAAGLDGGPRYLPDDAQTAGRDIARWRRFSGVAEFMQIGDQDRAVHVTRTSLLDEGRSLTAVTRTLADAFELERTLFPMSDDPVASIIHTPSGPMHFQECWVHRHAEPQSRTWSSGAPTGQRDGRRPDRTRRYCCYRSVEPCDALGPMLAIDAFQRALTETPVVAVSPFVEDTVFSGPAADLMAGVGYDPSTAGVAEAYPFADAFVLDEEDSTPSWRVRLSEPSSTLNDAADAERVNRAVETALSEVARCSNRASPSQVSAVRYASWRVHRSLGVRVSSSAVLADAGPAMPPDR